MIIRIEDLKDVCGKISAAVDASENDQITSTLQLKTEDVYLYLIVTNKEYYVKAKVNMYERNYFNATVNASLFLNLVSSTTSDTVTLNVEGNTLIVSGNGTYKLPLIQNDTGNILDIPEIVVENVTSDFNIEKQVFQGISNFNAKVLGMNGLDVQKTVQKMFYVDQDGCITSTSLGACVNTFHLENPIKVLFSAKLVKLFKLFSGENVHFRLGHTPITEEIMQTRVSFEDDNVYISCITGDDDLIKTLPATSIRKMAKEDQTFSVNLNRVALLDTVKRMLLFTNKQSMPFAKFKFGEEMVTVYDQNEINHESIYYDNDSPLTGSYTATLDLVNLKFTLEGSQDPCIVMQFGNKQTVSITKGNVCNVLCECGI